MEHKKCHVRRPDDCKDGNHLFVVSRWLLGAHQNSASGFTCQKCLLTAEGKSEIDKLKAEIDERDLQENNERSKPSPRSKSSKGSSGEAQET